MEKISVYTCSLFGHRKIGNYFELKKNLKHELKKQINVGFNKFIIGSHGDFDKIALCVLRELKKIYKNIEINVVLTSIYSLTKYDYNDVITLTYPIEETHYKRQITLSNQYMINDSNLIICYVNDKSFQSGALTTLKYAMKNNKKIINLYNKQL